MPFITMFTHLLAAGGIDSLGDAIGQFTSIFPTVWSFITSNWYFAALIFIPFGGMIVGTIISWIKSK